MKTASTEREAIVAALRAEADFTGRGYRDDIDDRLSLCLDRLADRIENGDHLKDQDHGRA